MADDVANKALEAVEMARNTGKLRRGTNEVTKALERGIAKLVVVARDVSPPEVVMHLPVLAKDKGIPCVTAGTKDELGTASGISVPTSAVAIVEAGDADKLIRQLSSVKGE